MCLIDGVLDRSSSQNLFRIRISAFGKNRNYKLYKEAEFPLYLGTDLRRPIQVSLTLPDPIASHVHAVTLTWAREITRNHLDSLMQLISERLGGFRTSDGDSGNWQDLASDIEYAFLRAQDLLLAYSREGARLPEMHALRENEKDPLCRGLVWISQTTPKRVSQEDFKKHFPNELDLSRNFVQAEVPYWFNAIEGAASSYFIDGMFRIPADFLLKNREIALGRVG